MSASTLASPPAPAPPCRGGLTSHPKANPEQMNPLPTPDARAQSLRGSLGNPLQLGLTSNLVRSCLYYTDGTGNPSVNVQCNPLMDRFLDGVRTPDSAVPDLETVDEEICFLENEIDRIKYHVTQQRELRLAAGLFTGKAAVLAEKKAQAKIALNRSDDRRDSEGTVASDDMALSETSTVDDPNMFFDQKTKCSAGSDDGGETLHARRQQRQVNSDDEADLQLVANRRRVVTDEFDPFYARGSYTSYSSTRRKRCASLDRDASPSHRSCKRQADSFSPLSPRASSETFSKEELMNKISNLEPEKLRCALEIMGVPYEAASDEVVIDIAALDNHRVEELAEYLDRVTMTTPPVEASAEKHDLRTPAKKTVKSNGGTPRATRGVSAGGRSPRNCKKGASGMAGRPGRRSSTSKKGAHLTGPPPPEPATVPAAGSIFGNEEVLTLTTADEDEDVDVV